MKITLYLIRNSIFICIALGMYTNLSLCGEEQKTQKHGSLKVISTTNAGDVPYGVFAENGYVYITNNNELLIFNVSDPSNPRKLGELPLQGSGHCIWLENNLAYIATSAGLEIIDVTDPAHPRQIEELGGLGCTHDIFVEGRLLFIASVKKDLIILEFDSE